MSSPGELKAGIANAILAFNNLKANGQKISASLNSQGTGQYPSSMTTADWLEAAVGWGTATSAAQKDSTALGVLITTFITALGTALNGTSKSARFDPLWDLMRSISLTSFSYETEFPRFLTEVQSYASIYDAAALAAGSTSPPPEQVALDAYPALVVSGSSSAGFLKAFKDGLAEDLAAVMLWAGSEDVSGNSEERMPRVLRQFKETGNTDYSISATMLTQFGAASF